ncbi:MAG: tetratricopeptide repeat protein [Candidatus Thorarchaeota archaeon]
MADPELKLLTTVEQLLDGGKLDEALELLNNLDQLERLNFQQKSDYQYLKFLILIYQNKHEELIKMGEIVFEEGQHANQNLHSFDGLYYIIMGLVLAEKFDEALNKIAKAETLIKFKSNLSKKALRIREERISVLKGYIYLNLVNIPLAEKYGEKTLGFQKDLGITFEIVWAHLILAQINLRVKSRYDIAMEYTNKAFSLAKKVKFNQYWVAMCYLFFGAIYGNIGELEHSLKQYKKSLTIFKELKNNWCIAMVLNNLTGVYLNLGKYDLALKHIEESLLFWERDSINTAIPISNIIEIALHKGDTKLAQKYYDKLENLYNKDKSIEIFYYFVKAIKLKKSSRIRDKAKAEKLFKKILGKETLYHDLIIHTYINLCDLLLAEFRFGNNLEVFDEINQFIAQLLILAEKSHSYIVFCETFILQAKLALLTFNTKAARRFLTQAQKIAESYGIKRLAMKISNEHDNLLKELHKWEILSESNASLTERIELARLDDQMTILLKRRSIEVPEVSKEDPVMLLILTEGGNLLFSKKFKKNFSFEDDILGGFLTTVNYIISEIFSEGLNRAVFGPFTLLMKPLQPFLICYIYKGNSYYAQIKIKNFLESLQNNNFIWQALQKFFEKSKSIQSNSIPSLESLITEIFIEKK